MAALPGPLEILELEDRQSVELRVIRAEVGETTIHPRYAGAPESKVVTVLRLHVPREAKPAGVPYWDLTAGSAVAQAQPFVVPTPPGGVTLRIVAFGAGPKKRYSVERL